MIEKTKEDKDTIYILWLCMYYLADDRWVEAVKFLDLGDMSGWELLQVSLSHTYTQ